jgi:hypothetical protein
MVDRVLDPLKPSVLTLSGQEMEEIYALIESGNLPPDYLDRCADARDANTFGIDAPKDKYGNRQEQGRGSPGNQTKQSVDAYRKWGVGDRDFERNLARMEKELAESDKRRAAEAAAAPKKGRRL